MEGLVDWEELILATDYDCDLDDSVENFQYKLLSRCKRDKYHKPKLLVLTFLVMVGLFNEEESKTYLLIKLMMLSDF